MERSPQPPPDGELLAARRLTLGYRKAHPVLHDAALTLHERERVLVTGPPGCGKSALLYGLVGLLRPLAGEVRFRGRACKKPRDFDAVREAVGVLLSDTDGQLLCPSLYDEVAFGPRQHRYGDVDGRVREALAIVGLAGGDNVCPQLLESAQRKRAALAGLLAMRPKALLIDDPLCGMPQADHDAWIALLVSLPCALLLAVDEATATCFPQFRRVDLPSAREPSRILK